jgi:anti-anti-sigma factor
MKIQEQRTGAVTILKPAGPLAGADVADFKTRALHALDVSLGRCVVDLSGVPFADSVGLECLLDLTESLTSSGQMLRMCGANKTLREVFALVGIAQQFEQFEDANMAVRSFL